MKIIVYSRLLFFVELIFGLIGLFFVLVILKMYSSFLDHPNMKPPYIFFFKMTFFPITLELSQILMSFNLEISFMRYYWKMVDQ
jgi:hypothetical protein